MAERVYRPLTGPELIECVLSQLRKKLEDTHLFEPHITYKRVEWNNELNVRTYPGDRGDIQVISSHTEEFAPPDLMREENGLSVLTPEKTPAGIAEIEKLPLQRLKKGK